MNKETQSEPLKKSWFAEHPLLVIGLLLIVCLGPFINKAVHTDDALFVWTAEWIQKHPADFFGFAVNWWRTSIPMHVANCNPPLMSYFLAGVASVFGGKEFILHLACLTVAFTAAAGVYFLARSWCRQPLLATVVTICTPVFLVSSTTLMGDVLMLAFWIWALVLWERALSGGQGGWLFAAAGGLAGLAVLTKYSAVTLLPLLPILSLLRTRRMGWWWVGLAMPLIMVAGYEWLTARLYGQGLLSAAAHFAQRNHSGFSGGWLARAIIGLAFAGGSLLPLLFFAPWVWRPRTLLVGGVVMVGILPGIFCRGSHLGLIHPWGNSGLMDHWDFVLQVMLLTAGGLYILLLVVAEARQWRDIHSVMLVLWVLSGLNFAMVLNWTVSARSFLPIAPAAAILLVRRLAATGGNFLASGQTVWLLIPPAAVSLSLVAADYHLANSARTAATQITAKYQPAGHTLWFENFGGFEYYMQKLGGQPLDVERSVLQPGDIVVVPWLSGGSVAFPADSVGWVEGLKFRPFSWINLMAGNGRSTAGFYDANSGPVPFGLGGVPAQDYFVVKVFSTVEYKTQPGNPREVQAGDVPTFPTIFFRAEKEMTFPGPPEAINRARLGAQLAAEGKIEEAIQHYRMGLNLDSNNPVILNQLAWILATAGKPELRRGTEAVQLATRAVALTNRRQPAYIGTLAAAYAETGQFPIAAQIAQTARILAALTNQADLVAKYEIWSSLYAAGKTVDAGNNP